MNEFVSRKKSGNSVNGFAKFAKSAKFSQTSQIFEVSGPEIRKSTFADDHREREHAPVVAVTLRSREENFELKHSLNQRITAQKGVRRADPSRGERTPGVRKLPRG